MAVDFLGSPRRLPLKNKNKKQKNEFTRSGAMGVPQMDSENFSMGWVGPTGPPIVKSRVLGDGTAGMCEINVAETINWLSLVDQVYWTPCLAGETGSQILEQNRD